MAGNGILRLYSFLPEYLYNLYRCEKYRLKAAYADSGTTVRALPAEVLEEQLVPLPDLSTQLAINEIISLIERRNDASIESVNSQTNPKVIIGIF